MLLIQKLEYYDNLTPNEQTVAHYLLDNQHRIQDISITEIAKETYTSLSTTVRLAQKCGCQGWKELKKALSEEISYLNKETTHVDANYPFQHGDSIFKIAKNMSSLLTESILDTYQLLDHDYFQKAILLLNSCQTINVYGITHPISVAYDFKLKMRTIGKTVNIVEDEDSYYYQSFYTTKDMCSLFISYSGETLELLDAMKRIKKKGCPLIALTSIGDNTFSKLADTWLPISTKEKLSNKIATFSSNISIHYLLDLIFACVFEHDYQRNIGIKKGISKELDHERFSNVSLLKDEDRKVTET